MFTKNFKRIYGAGKTSQMDNIVAIMDSRGYECITTREPGGTMIGKQIRSILLSPENQELDSGAELLLYVADRVQHIKTIIEPHLGKDRRVVLSDRFFDATLVYQGYARGLDKKLIYDLHRLVCGNLKPDLTLLFDLDPKIGLARAWQQINCGDRTDQESRFEEEKLIFHEKVRKGYLELARDEPDRFRVIDAQQTPRQVTEQIEQVLSEYIYAL